MNPFPIPVTFIKTAKMSKYLHHKSILKRQTQLDFFLYLSIAIPQLTDVGDTAVQFVNLKSWPIIFEKLI